MSGLQEFDPDGIYCVHCHAPAAGMCARCGALCCADCVELRLGLTREQAVCRACLADEPAPKKRAVPRWLAVAMIAMLAVMLWWWMRSG